MKRFASTRSEILASQPFPGRAQCSVGSIDDVGMRYGLTTQALIASTIAIAPPIVSSQSRTPRHGCGIFRSSCICPRSSRYRLSRVGREVFSGHLDLLLLSALAGEPRHGWGVIDHVRRRSGGRFDYPEGTIYPALHRLEEERLLRSRWSSVDGRRRRVYELSRKGKKAFADERRAWRDLAKGIELVLESAG